MGKIKSPLRYPGGKSRIADTLISFAPEFSEYREPFVGGGSVFINMIQKYPNASYWINDLYYDLYCFWRELKCNPIKLIQQIKDWRNIYTDGKLLHQFLLDHLSSFNDIERGAAFFIINRITFSGTSFNGGYSQESFEKRFTESSIQRTLNLQPLLQNVNISNLDYSDIINTPGDNVFIYLDPPLLF